MIRTSGFRDVNFYDDDGPRNNMLDHECGRNSIKRWFSSIGAYEGHVEAADGWFYVRQGRGRYRITSGLTTRSCRGSNDGYSGSMSRSAFDKMKNRF